MTGLPIDEIGSYKLEIAALRRDVERLENIAEQRLDNTEPTWIVNDMAELGVKIGDRCFFLYKGESIEYTSGLHDNGTPIKWRPVGKREFGEVCHPIKPIIDNIQNSVPIPFPYTLELQANPGLDFVRQDGFYDWKPLPITGAPDES